MIGEDDDVINSSAQQFERTPQQTARKIEQESAANTFGADMDASVAFLHPSRPHEEQGAHR